MNSKPSQEARRVKWILVSMLLATLLGPPILIYATNFLHLRWYLHASLGDEISMLQLGLAHTRRNDNQRTLYWYEKAARKGNAVGMFELYRNSANVEFAKYWLIKSGEAGLIDAMVELKDNYYYGRAGFEIDKNKSLFWYYQCGEHFKKSLIQRGTTWEAWLREKQGLPPADPNDYVDIPPTKK